MAVCTAIAATLEQSMAFLESQKRICCVSRNDETALPSSNGSSSQLRSTHATVTSELEAVLILANVDRFDSSTARSAAASFALIPSCALDDLRSADHRRSSASDPAFAPSFPSSGERRPSASSDGVRAPAAMVDWQLIRSC